MNTAANANLFSRLFDGLNDTSRLAIEKPTARASAMAI
jgi:malonyl-CoA/methylmalonyl-CoA synthetase